MQNPEKETQDGWTVLRKTVSSAHVANFGSEKDPAYFMYDTEQLLRSLKFMWYGMV